MVLILDSNVHIKFVHRLKHGKLVYCSDSLLNNNMPLGIKMLILVESSYLSHYPCKSLGPWDVAFKRYRWKCSESSESVELSRHFAYNF